jgi:hypothetical protein
MSEPHDWPIEQAARGSLRPWYFAAAGHMTVLFMDPDEAERARHDLIGRGVPEGDLRLYGAEETLRIVSRRQEERSILAKAFDALVAITRPGNAMSATPRPAGRPCGSLPPARTGRTGS